MTTATKKVDTKKVANHWSTFGAAPPKQWLHSMYLRRKVLLDPLQWHGGCWFNWLQRTYFQEPAGKVLSLCCGSGRHERRMAQVGIGNKIVGLDISDGQLERARIEGEKAGYGDILEYRQSNIQQATLPENEYDFIIVVAGLHHLIRLPHVLEQVHKSLKPDGLFAMTEYVGADHMDYAPHVRSLYQNMLLSIPEEKRLRESNRGTLIRAGQQTREQAIARDPSEGVNSSQIMKNIRKFFEIDVEVEMGSSLLREVFYDIIGNFDDDDEKDNEVIDRIIDVDRSLRKAGILSNDHVFGTYRPKLL